MNGDVIPLEKRGCLDCFVGKILKMLLHIELSKQLLRYWCFFFPPLLGDQGLFRNLANVQ